MEKNEHQIIRQLFNDYLRMYSTRDDRLITYFSEDFSGFTGGGDFLVKNREEWIAITRQDFAQVKDPIRIELKDLAIQLLADTIAVATGFFTIHLPIEDHILSRETARLVLIFRSESTGWKISHSSISIPYYLVREGEIYPMKELVDRNQFLEKLVAERTNQLSEANENLRQANEKLAREIAEHMKSEKALRLTQFSIDRAAIAIFRAGSDARILNVNEQACKDLGYSESELCQMTIFDINPTVNDNNWVGIWQTLLDQKRFNFETEHRRQDGTIFPAEITSNLLEFGGKKYSISFVRDITEQKRAEKALRLTQFSFDRASIGIFQIGSDARVLNVNHQACKDLGYSESELCQMTIFDFNPIANVNDWGGIWQKLLDQKNDHFETEHRRKDGTIFPVEITANLLEFEETLYAICFVRDITVKNNNEKLRAKMQAGLQQAQRLDSLGTLAGGIAHDFNNILSAIMGYTELTKLSCSDNPTVQHYLDQLGSASLRAKNLVQQILNFSRQSDSEKHPIDISRIVNEALNLIRATLPTTIEISKNVPSDLGVIVANETQIHQIVMNLCTNAHHAMDEEGGLIDVELSTTTISAKDGINYPDLDPGEYLKLIITDTGSGIPSEILTKIFDPYFTTKNPGEGTGLGLSTVHGIVKDHGGCIKVYSEQGRGTSFQIFLPITKSRTERTDNSVGQLPHGNETILFVDDEKLLLEIGKELLESLGYRVETRASSIDALEAFRVQPAKYDLIVSDMTMPKITGELLAVEIKKIKPDVPIILCTGYSTRLNSEKLIKIGIAKVLMKPVTFNELAVNVREALDRV